LRSELFEVLGGLPGFEAELRWLKAGYHVLMEKLELKLAEALEGLAGRAEEVRILFGDMCLPEIRRVTGDFKLMPASNCLVALLGLEKLRRLEKGPAMVVTPAWIREIFLSRDKELPVWDESEFRANLGRYERRVVIDSGLEPLTDEETITAFDLMGKVLETELVPLDHFRALVTGFLR
jgi:hypothetical protein